MKFQKVEVGPIHDFTALPCRPSFAKKHFLFRMSCRGRLQHFLPFTWLHSSDLFRASNLLKNDFQLKYLQKYLIFQIRSWKMPPRKHVRTKYSSQPPNNPVVALYNSNDDNDWRQNSSGSSITEVSGAISPWRFIRPSLLRSVMSNLLLWTNVAAQEIKTLHACQQEVERQPSGRFPERGQLHQFANNCSPGHMSDAPFQGA